MSNFETIQLRHEGALVFITLNREAKLNAVNPQMIQELNRALDLAEASEAVRVIVLDGAGRAFSAGFDLNPNSSPGDADRPEALRRELEDDFALIMRFWDSPKVTLAAVHGYCLGSAMEMALACDLTLAAEGCRFGAPEVKFGSGIVALILPWIAGPKRAKELLLTGTDQISAEQALAYGLVNRVVAVEDLADAARKLAVEIAANDELAVRLTKQAINRSCEVAGMRQAMLQALELDISIEGTETESSRHFDQILKTEGAKAAIAWRRGQVKE